MLYINILESIPRNIGQVPTFINAKQVLKLITTSKYIWSLQKLKRLTSIQWSGAESYTTIQAMSWSLPVINRAVKYRIKESLVVTETGDNAHLWRHSFHIKSGQLHANHRITRSSSTWGTEFRVFGRLRSDRSVRPSDSYITRTPHIPVIQISLYSILKVELLSCSQMSFETSHCSDELNYLFLSQSNFNANEKLPFLFPYK